MALDHAVRMASWYDATLELLHVTVLGDEDPFHPPDHLPDREEIHRRLRRIQAKETKWQITARAGALIKVRRHQRRAQAAAPEILRFITEKAIDLVVIGGHGQRGFRPSFLGSVTEEVVRLATCPVLTIPAPIDTQTSGRRAGGAHSGHCVVPIDFSEHSAAALRAAKGLAVAYGGRLDLVHVIEPMIGPRAPGVHEASLAATIERLSGFADNVLGRPRVEYRTEVIEGIAAASITAYATSSRADLLVIATHGLTGQRHFLLGSVSEKVVRTATCPVLTIKGPHTPDAHEGAAAGLA